MKNFLLKSEPDKDGCIDLKGDDYHYLVRVRRLAVGEFFSALLPGGESAVMRVISIKEGILTCKIENQKSESGDSHQRVILFQALPKADKMDLIVRQAAESGIAEIVPFVSEFSVAKTSAAGQKFSRWEHLIKEARQQSGSLTATALHEPLSMNGLFSYWQGIKKGTDAVGLMFHHEKGLEQKSLHGYLDRSPKAVVLAVGPEGGFSDKEAALFIENGFKPFTIGENILRTETAALYCAAAVRIILLERDTWELNKQS
ncbi:MAG: 16S rRNA (uracil(1498)-N(3))-methyltransferase [Treponema sp.]|nr:16S rRNA (uracil(1498)-N(3))-methyltransferase [Treponema sp.]